MYEGHPIIMYGEPPIISEPLIKGCVARCKWTLGKGLKYGSGMRHCFECKLSNDSQKCELYKNKTNAEIFHVRLRDMDMSKEGYQKYQMFSHGGKA